MHMSIFYVISEKKNIGGVDLDAPGNIVKNKQKSLSKQLFPFDWLVWTYFTQIGGQFSIPKWSFWPIDG